MWEDLRKVGKYTFGAGIIVTIYGLAKTFLDRRNLPEGVCPIEDNRNVMYIGIALLLISAVLDFILDYRLKIKKRDRQSEKQDK